MQEQLISQQAIYQSLPIEVSVVFADKAQCIETLEGPVLCQLGDAILTGVKGERWPVSASKFSEKYAPSGGQAPGSPGRYVKLPTEIRALRLSGAMDITLSDGRGVLHGEAGDWCVRYSTLFTTAVDIINTLSAAQAHGNLKRELHKYLQPRLLSPP